MDFRTPATILGLIASLAGALAFAEGEFLLGAALLVAGVIALHWPGELWRGDEPPELTVGWRCVLLLGLAAVTLFFRFYRFVPPGLWGDDAINGLLALDVLDGKVTSPFQLVSHSQSRFHALSNYPLAAAFALLGPSLASLRLPGTILGSFCVFLVYATFAPLFRARVALCAALFFATSAMQIEHGKILIQVVTGQFLLLLGMCLLVRGIAARRGWLVALSGVPLGLALCTYHSFKLAPAIAVPFAVAALLTAPRPRGSRLGAWYGVAAAVALLAAAPGLLAYAHEPTALTGRIGGTSVVQMAQKTGALAAAWDSLWRTLTLFHFQQGPVLYHWFGVGTDPALDPILAALVLAGFVQSVRRWREPRHVLLLSWFAIGLLPGILSSEAPRVYRVLMATPPVFVWAALPVERLLARAALERSRVSGALAALILLAVPVYDFNYYFYRVYTDPRYEWMQGGRLVALASALRDQGPGWKGDILSATYDSDHETLRFLRRIWNLDLRDVSSLSEVLPPRLDENTLFLFDPTTIPSIDAFAAFYPRATPRFARPPRPRSSWLDDLFPPNPAAERPPNLASLAVSKSAAQSLRGLDAVFLDGEGVPITTRRWSELAYGGGAPTAAARLAVAGSLYAPATGTYRFFLDGKRPATVWLDGQPLLHADGREASLDLTEGLHPLAVRLADPADARFAVRWQSPGQKEATDIPPALLFQDSAPHGWLAEYDNGTRQLRRLEPMPRYLFFRPAFEGHYRVRWTGRLAVPPGGRSLQISSRGKLTATVDGEPWDRGKVLPEGLHPMELVLEDVQGATLLELTWRENDAVAKRVPPEAFLPP